MDKVGGQNYGHQPIYFYNPIFSVEPLYRVLAFCSENGQSDVKPAFDRVK